MSNNLELWDKVAEVPKEAQKPITAGRLRGMTDINPMWRIKKLTEIYGQCGIGWKAQIIAQWLEIGANNEIVANVKIELFVKNDGEWSEGIQGIGGSMLVTKETAGLHTSDEAYKMAYTDAISVACKMLGFGADIYWAEGKSKYNSETPFQKAQKALTVAMNDKIKNGMTKQKVLDSLKTFNSQKDYTRYDEKECQQAIEFLKVLE